MGKPAELAGPCNELTAVMVNASAPALLLPRKKSKLKTLLAVVLRATVTVKVPVRPLRVEVDGVSDHELCANVAPAIARTQVRMIKSVFMGLVLVVLEGSIFWQSADGGHDFSLIFPLFFRFLCLTLSARVAQSPPLVFNYGNRF